MNATKGPVRLVAAATVFLMVPAVVLVLIAGTMTMAGPALGDCAGAGTGQQVAGIDLDAEQMGNAATITAVAAGRGLPAHAAVIAVAVAYQESKLYNLPGGDRDSKGLFQQRISIYPEAVATDPARATGAFLDQLVTVPGWATLPVTVAGQAVQRSAFPNAYARWQVLATQVVAQLWPAAAHDTTGPGPVASCPQAGGTGARLAGTTRIPAGLVVAGTPAARAAVTFALAQLGKPYRWGGVGPDAYDCSGLTMAAWAAAGTALPRTTSAQVHAGTPTSLGHAAAGDLVFIPGTGGSPATPGHVGMIAGYTDGPTGRHLLIVVAPRTGQDIELIDAATWAGQVAAVRHIR